MTQAQYKEASDILTERSSTLDNGEADWAKEHTYKVTFFTFMSITVSARTWQEAQVKAQHQRIHENLSIDVQTVQEWVDGDWKEVYSWDDDE